MSSVGESIGILIELVQQLPREPAMVDIETFVNHETPCGRNVSAYPHWNMLLKKQVPTLSYSELLCYGPHAFWQSEHDQQRCSFKDESDFVPHPGRVTHALVSHLVASFLVDKAMDACTALTVQTDEDKADSADEGRDTQTHTHTHTHKHTL
eukprot:TRINITY_DN30953_c0_g1_i1.p1 TRINITY_DN30953_c0_g1~~TRINITY_DN30953_c0_g1_i1.p1  ORF type:complete len:152 (+),score=14.37 TRINITY_DN30953_c0_g1_i1:209-664(+)